MPRSEAEFTKTPKNALFRFSQVKDKKITHNAFWGQNGKVLYKIIFRGVYVPFLGHVAKNIVAVF